LALVPDRARKTRERQIVIFGIVFPEGRARSLGILIIEIGVGVFVGAVKGEDELLVELPPG
jgi:hypothetical protein